MLHEMFIELNSIITFISNKKKKVLIQLCRTTLISVIILWRKKEISIRAGFCSRCIGISLISVLSDAKPPKLGYNLSRF